MDVEEIETEEVAEEVTNMEEGTSIELFISKDGKMSVSMESESMETMETEGMEVAGEVETEENSQPVANLEEALQVIRTMAETVTASEDGLEEEAAYKQEMGSGMGNQVGL